LIKGKILPGRTFSRDCHWSKTGRYTATECGVTNATLIASYPACDGTLDNCIIRKNRSRYGGFVSIPQRGIVII
ncbi:unnamed protein product, partial [marine sediment metagenome]